MVDMKEYMHLKINAYRPKLILHKQFSNNTQFVISFESDPLIAACVSVGGLGGIPNANAIRDALDVRFSNAVFGLKEAIAAGVGSDDVRVPEREDSGQEQSPT